MPSRYYQRDFVPGNYYHIFNRGSRKQKIFITESDYDTFKEILSYFYRFPNGVSKSRITKENLSLQVRNLSEIELSFSIVGFCLLPNHFHLLVKQINKPEITNSIINFMKRLSITYSMYFKDKHDHSGTLFEGKYKNVLVNKESQLLYITKYIHRNPLEYIKHGKKLENYPHSSYSAYLGKSQCDWIKFDEILKYFSTTNPRLTYKAFVEGSPDMPDSIGKLILD